jgi:hypothetical protein
MDFILEVLLEFAVELLFMMLGGLFSGNETDKVISSTAALGLLGVALGWVSTLLFPEALLSTRTLQLAWLAASPFAGGGAIVGVHLLLGRAFTWRKFLRGALFVGALELTRFVALG